MIEPAALPLSLPAHVCQRALDARDPRFDGLFYVGIVTTGIYCRPTCPSRRPKRDRAEAVGQPAAAEQAGFRACRRCRPGGPAHGEAHSELAARTRQLIDEHPDESRRADVTTAVKYCPAFALSIEEED